MHNSGTVRHAAARAGAGAVVTRLQGLARRAVHDIDRGAADGRAWLPGYLIRGRLRADKFRVNSVLS